MVSLELIPLKFHGIRSHILIGKVSLGVHTVLNAAHGSFFLVSRKAYTQ
jgi:hypothetical protein